MIRLTRCTQASKAGTYFRLHLEPGDSQANPTPATTARFSASWTGSALPDIKLAPFDAPTASHLVRLGRGLHPIEKKRLAPGVNRKRAYYDLLLTAPKTVSIAALLDPTHPTATSVLAAHKNAVAAVCGLMGRMIEPTRRNHPSIKRWLGAVFIHTHTREGDPHLHSHLIVPNVGRNAAGDWRAVQVNISGVRRSRLEATYGHELACSLRRFGLGPEIVMQGCDPELKTLLPLAEHFARAGKRVVESAKKEVAKFEPIGRQPKTLEIHSRSKLPLRADRIQVQVRQGIADEIRRPKPKDADDPKKLSAEAYRWRSMLTNQEDRTLFAVLDAADVTNPRRVKVLANLPPPISVIVRRAFESIPWGVPTTAPVLFRAVIAESAGQHALEDLRTAVKERMERRKKNLARMWAQAEADSIAMAQAQETELERDRQARARRANAPQGPAASASASEAVATPLESGVPRPAAESVERTEAVAPAPTRKRGPGR